LLDLFIESAKKLGRRRALVVHSRDGLDEISVCGKTMVRELKNGRISSYEIDPKDFGIKGFALSDLEGKTAIANASLFRQIIGKKRLARRQAAVKAAVCLNAGAALYVCGKAGTIQDGYALAVKTVEGKGMERYLRKMTNGK